LIGIPPNTVQLWVWRIDRDAPFPPNCLSPEDEAHAAHFLRAEDQMYSRVSRAGLRAILGSCLGVEPLLLAFDIAPMGKPSLAFPADTGMHFNLSHSHGLAALGISRFPIGVDIEAVRPVEDDLAHTVFSPTELDEFARLTPAERSIAFFLGWTRKEAVVKALGSGLHAPLDRFSVSLTPGQPALLRDIGWSPGEEARWQIETVAVPTEHVGAVAAAERGWQLVAAGGGAISVLGLAGPKERVEVGLTPPRRNEAGG
jgi:4'-phosphopantetheinyl transferase